MTFVNGSRYEGEYQNGWQSGEGTLVFEDGAVYQGEFLEDKFHGYGILAGMDGSVYAGNWRQGYRHGKGQWMGPKKQMPEAEKTDTPEPTQFNLHSEYWDAVAPGQHSEYWDAVAPGQESQPQAMRPEERIAWSLEMLQEQGALDINRGGYEGEWENDMPHGQGSRQFPGGGVTLGSSSWEYQTAKDFFALKMAALSTASSALESSMEAAFSELLWTQIVAVYLAILGQTGRSESGVTGH
eukprot:CAMPEP_0175982736 /NCGR_PEP_ID=MMETSP0108-20121206/48071_1 /TAXON_ID=195067 ORGANISM="Goniomonas pacifica, Strain CCMP1869" /NCGR_SAMPLE_ID=MMETSP0108 /ASSEMBLY_ACC=CAM_ASM_000204 /LENGTH=239 /DNA_ID=CAMNT_0017313439 /DNA_START=27 /DNA_END=747 /DNA_ORIENTATION=+